jgi:CRP-like cAMP-binding protein
MQKEPTKRYHSGDELADELLGALRAGLGSARRAAFGDADKFAALRAMRFFRAFSDPELWEVVKLASWERVSAGAALLREGDPGEFFCVLVEGEVRVTKNKKLLSVLSPGECFGEMAYLASGERTRGASVTAAAESRILRMPVAELEEASISCRSKFDRAFVAILVERLNLANTRLTSG